MRLSLPTVLSLLAVAVVVAMGVAFLVAGHNLIPVIEMGRHGWIALGLGTVFSVLVGGTLTTVLVVSRRRGFDESAHEARLDLGEDS
jgi:uncharacterized membrane protein